jgi:hypothetical protein
LFFGYLEASMSSYDIWVTQLLDGLGNDVWPFIASIIMWRIWNACNSKVFIGG